MNLVNSCQVLIPFLIKCLQTTPKTYERVWKFSTCLSRKLILTNACAGVYSYIIHSNVHIVLPWNTHLAFSSTIACWGFFKFCSSKVLDRETRFLSWKIRLLMNDVFFIWVPEKDICLLGEYKQKASHGYAPVWFWCEHIDGEVMSLLGPVHHPNTKHLLFHYLRPKRKTQMF